MPTSPSRRAVLAALSTSAAAGLAGCSTPWGRLRVQPLGGDPPPTAPPPGPDEVARRAAAAAVSAALAQVGSLDAPVAEPLRATLGEQLVALGETPPTASAASSTPSTPGATGTPSSTTTTSSPSVSASSGAGGSASGGPGALEQVAGLLDDAAGTAATDLAGVAGGTARLLACLSAGLVVAAGWARSAVAPSAGSAAPAASPSTASASAASPSAASSAQVPSSQPAQADPTPPDGSGEQEALVAALAVEEAAQYGYGVLAVRLDGAQVEAAVADLATHTDLVELLRADLLAQGAAPPAPQPAWALPSPVSDAAGALALAQQLEGASTAAWADVVAAADRERRAAASSQLLLAAQRWQAWRTAAGAPGLVALPGLSGR